MVVFQDCICISPALPHWSTMSPWHGSIWMLQLQLWEADSSETQHSNFGLLKAYCLVFFHGKVKYLIQRPCCLSLRWQTFLKKPISKFGGSQIISPVLPRGTRLVKRRDVSTVIKGHRVSHRGPFTREREGEMWTFLCGLSIHFTPLSSEGRRGKGERNKAGN